MKGWVTLWLLVGFYSIDVTSKDSQDAKIVNVCVNYCIWDRVKQITKRSKIFKVYYDFRISSRKFQAKSHIFCNVALYIFQILSNWDRFGPFLGWIWPKCSEFRRGIVISRTRTPNQLPYNEDFFFTFHFFPKIFTKTLWLSFY